MLALHTARDGVADGLRRDTCFRMGATVAPTPILSVCGVAASPTWPITFPWTAFICVQVRDWLVVLGAAFVLKLLFKLDDFLFIAARSASIGFAAMFLLGSETLGVACPHPAHEEKNVAAYSLRRRTLGKTPPTSGTE